MGSQWPWLASLLAQLVKNLPTMWEIWVWSLGWEDSPEEGKGYLLQYSGLGIPSTVQSIGSQRVRQDWATFTFHGHGWAEELSSNSRPSCWPTALSDSFSAPPLFHTCTTMNKFVYRRGTGDVLSVWILRCLAVAMGQTPENTVSSEPMILFPFNKNWRNTVYNNTHGTYCHEIYSLVFVQSSKIQVYKYICWNHVADCLWVACIIFFTLWEAPFLACCQAHVIIPTLFTRRINSVYVHR